MSKVFYSDYVSHCLRFYCRNQEQPSGIPLADLRNWEAAHNAVRLLTSADREIVNQVYVSSDNVNDSVRAISARTGRSADEIWRVIKGIEKAVAQERGLV